MLSGPPDTAIPNRSTSAGRSISLSVSFLNRERRDSSSAFGTGAPLGHDILQPTRSRRAVHVVKFIINLACIAWLFELDQCLPQIRQRSEEHTSELQSLMRISYAVLCLKKKIKKQQTQ